MKKIFLFFALTFIFTTLFSQSYNIKFKVNGVTDSIAILGYHFGDKKYVKDTVKIIKNQGVFKGDKPLAHGMYFILFPKENNFFDILIDDDQQFSLTTDTTNFFRKNLKFKGSVANSEFRNFDKSIENVNEEFAELTKKFKQKDLSDKQKTELQNKAKELEKQRRKIILNNYNNAKNSTFKSVIGLLLEPEIPKFTVSENTTNKDSILKTKEYYYYKNHYFDYVNFTDSVIIRTPFFIPKFEKYISQIISQNPDTVAKECINLIEKARGNNPVFSYLINYSLVYNEKAKLMGMDKVFVEIAKKYYATGEATWADSAYKAKVIDKMKKTEPNLIGNYAPDIRNVETYEGKTTSLNKIKNKYKIIIFWSPTCGHCKKSVPKLYKYYKELKQQNIDVEVFAVLESRDVDKWRKFIKDKEITDWINVYDKTEKTYFHYYYDVFSTPVIYVLDKNFKIIAKRISAEQAKDYILQLEKNKQ
jgi:thiol-disulfide isomerase/thioredoxin